MFHSVNTFFHKDLLYPSSSASTSTRPCPSRATTKYNSAEHFWIQELTLICLKSSLNPIIYCWKIREVRQPVKETIRRQFFVVHRQRRNHRLKKSWNGKQNKTATLLAQSLDPLLVLLPNTVRRLEFFMTWGRCFSPILQRVLRVPFTAVCTPHLLGRGLSFISQAAMIGFACVIFELNHFANCGEVYHVRIIQVNIWKTINLNCGERYDDIIDHRSFRRNLGSFEIKAWKRIRHYSGIDSLWTPFIPTDFWSWCACLHAELFWFHNLSSVQSSPLHCFVGKGIFPCLEQNISVVTQLLTLILGISEGTNDTVVGVGSALNWPFTTDVECGLPRFALSSTTILVIVVKMLWALTQAVLSGLLRWLPRVFTNTFAIERELEKET